MIVIQAMALAIALVLAGALFTRRAWSLYRLLRSGKRRQPSGNRRSAIQLKQLRRPLRPWF